VVFYNRSNEAAAQLQPEDFNWEEIFSKNNVRWFHSGGIFSALSESTPEVIIAGMKAAKAAGCKVSFDLNYRAKLWNLLGGSPEGGLKKCQEVMCRIAEQCDVLVGNEEDLQLGLGVVGPDVEKKGKLDTSAFIGIIEETVRRFPNVKVTFDTLTTLGHLLALGLISPQRRLTCDAALAVCLHHPPRGPLHQPPLLERGLMDQRRDFLRPPVRARRSRPCRWR